MDERAAHTFAAEVLAPVLDRPQVEATQLLGTLRAWLHASGHWDHTAAALSVHRNTVRNRIAKIAALLDLDLTDPGVRVDLWPALEWCDPATLPEPPAGGLP